MDSVISPEMGIFEFDQELHDKTLYEDGVTAGIERAFLVCKKIQEGETDTNTIAESIGCKPEEVELIRKQFEI